MRTYSCADFEDLPHVPSCCNGCHGEWEDGYGEPSQVQFGPIGEHNRAEHTAYVCCTLEKWLLPRFADLVTSGAITAKKAKRG